MIAVPSGSHPPQIQEYHTAKTISVISRVEREKGPDQGQGDTANHSDAEILAIKYCLTISGTV
jgi:hypothetical protein